MIFAVYAIVLVVYWFCPKYLQLVMMAANMFVPDAVPVIDEVIMVAGLVASGDR